MPTHVALLRSVNVGGRGKVTMAQLRALFEAEGLGGVRTWITSGNVLFEIDRTEAELASRLEARVREELGLDTRVLLRDRAELDRAIADNPFLDRGAPGNQLFAVFLGQAPSPEAFARLDPQRSPPDAFALRDRTLYLHLPSGAADTRLTLPYIERCLGTWGTARNWNTTTRLAALLAE